MIAKHIIDQQLKEIGTVPRFFGRAEIRELSNILFEGEIVRHLVLGRYEGGWATLCATDHRVLLVDKKPLYLTIEDMRYDMIADVQYNHRLLNASVCLGTMHKTITFVGYNHEKLRALTTYIQEQVMHARSVPGQTAEPESVAAPPVSSLEAAPPTVASVLTQLQEPRRRLPPVNPYRSPVIVRRRVSRFY